MQTAFAPSPAQLRRTKLTFGLIYFFCMLAKAIFGPFITVFLSEKGLSAELIGVVTGINSIVIILTQPVWGLVNDRVGSTGKTLALSMAGQALLALSLLLANNFMFIAAAFSCYTVFTSAEGPLLDVWCLKSLKQAGDEKAAGQLKMWGCVGYALCAVGSGMFVSRFSTSAAIPIFASVLGALFIAMLFISRSDNTRGGASFKDMQLGRILRDKAFLAFLVYIFFMQITHRGSYTFYSLRIKQMGGSTSIVGYASALMFVSEAVVMGLLKKMLKKTRALNLVMISSFFFATWFLLISISTNPYQVMLSCLMDGPSFALFTMGTLYYLHEIAPSEIRTTYQTVAYSVYFGLSGIAGNVICGWMIDNLGYQAMYSCGIALTLCATAVFFLFTKNRERRAARA